MIILEVSIAKACLYSKLENILSTEREFWGNINLKLGISGQLPQRRQWHPTPVFLPGKSHGWRSLEGCSPWGRWRSDTTERLHFHFLLSCIGEGNGNPLQCSCLENPRDRGAWWAAVYGVAQSRTRLKRLAAAAGQLPQSVSPPLSHVFSCGSSHSQTQITYN